MVQQSDGLAQVVSQRSAGSKAVVVLKKKTTAV